MSRNQTVEDLLNSHGKLWKGRRRNHSQRTLSSGHQRLDSCLPGSGWPVGAVTEILTGQHGQGEFRLLFPALAEIGQQGQWVILIDPPWIPYPAALNGNGLALERLLVIHGRDEKQSRWACEQALRNGRGGAVLAWPQKIGFAQLRRLQLAAESRGKLAFLFRPEQATTESSPAALRLQLAHEAGRSTTRIDILKCRGHRPSEPLWLPLQETFSCYENPGRHTAQHAAPTGPNRPPLLAGTELSAPGAEPVHAGSEDAAVATGRFRDDPSTRVRH